MLTSHRVGTVSRLSVVMKDWASAYSESESAGEENRELVERSSMQDRSCGPREEQKRRGQAHRFAKHSNVSLARRAFETETQKK